MEPITIGLLIAGIAALSSAGKGKGGRSISQDAVNRTGPLSLGNLENLVGRYLLSGTTPVRISGNDVKIIRYMLEGFAGGILTLDEQFMLVSFAWHETRWNPAAVGHVDKKWGNSYTLFQLRRDVELKGALESLGYTLDQVVPPEGTPVDQLRVYVQRQAKCAEWLAKQKRVTKSRQMSGGDLDLECVDFAAKWGGCGGGSWAGVLKSSIAGPILNGRVPDSAQIPAVNAALNAAAVKIGQRSSCVPGILNRLVTYRTLRGVLVS